MKKTLIALLALAGVAAADSYTAAEVNAWINSVSSTVGGSKYTLTFTLADDFNLSATQGEVIISFGTYGGNAWNIRQQDDKHLGLGTPASDGQFATRYSNDVTSVDLDTANNGQAQYKGWFYTGTTNDELAGCKFSIYTANNDTTITFTPADEDRAAITLQRDVYIPIKDDKGGKTTMVFHDYKRNEVSLAYLTDISIEYDGGTLTIPPHPTPPVPEPATATLSLLALAGLASRRRRK